MVIIIGDENLISTRGLAEIVGLTPDRVRQLEDEGLISSTTKSGKKYFDLVPSLKAFFGRGRKKEEQPEEVTAEQIALVDLRYKTARAGKMELELQELRGTMHHAEGVELMVTDMVAKLRGMVLALPGQLAVDTANAQTAKEASAIIKKAVDDLLNDMAAYRYDEED